MKLSPYHFGFTDRFWFRPLGCFFSSVLCSPSGFETSRHASLPLVLAICFFLLFLFFGFPASMNRQYVTPLRSKSSFSKTASRDAHSCGLLSVSCFFCFVFFFFLGNGMLYQGAFLMHPLIGFQGLCRSRSKRDNAWCRRMSGLV